MRLRKLSHTLALIALGLLNQGCAAGSDITSHCQESKNLCIDSLSNLSIETLRQREYGSRIHLKQNLNNSKPNDQRYLASYLSDGLEIYTRVDIPATSMPETGYPVLVFAHGWTDTQASANYDFSYDNNAMYAMLVDTFTNAGFIVLMPGFRGHGTLAGNQADGFDYLTAWNNASYLSPTYYAIDTLNLIDSISSLNDINWQKWHQNIRRKPNVDLSRVYLLAHSQGGDVALTTLAIAGEGSGVKTTIKAASIWAGNIPARFTQAETFRPMASSLEAFMSGDGTWTGSAVGKDGSVNPNFIFPYPSDWIGTIDTQSAKWTWQKEVWQENSIKKIIQSTYQEMYDTLNYYVRDLEDATFSVTKDSQGQIVIQHNRDIAKKMAHIGGYEYPKYLSEPIALHYGEHDYYSMPKWNEILANKITLAGGEAYAFMYPHNNHSLKASEHEWFSPTGTEDGQDKAITRDLQLFSDQIPQ